MKEFLKHWQNFFLLISMFAFDLYIIFDIKIHSYFLLGPPMKFKKYTFEVFSHLHSNVQFSYNTKVYMWGKIKYKYILQHQNGKDVVVSIRPLFVFPHLQLCIVWRKTFFRLLLYELSFLLAITKLLSVDSVFHLCNYLHIFEITQ